jgi:hypothetical protein
VAAAVDHPLAQSSSTSSTATATTSLCPFVRQLSECYNKLHRIHIHNGDVSKTQQVGAYVYERMQLSYSNFTSMCVLVSPSRTAAAAAAAAAQLAAAAAAAAAQLAAAAAAAAAATP